MRQMDEFAELAIKRQIEELFTGRYFDITAFKNLAEMLEVTPDYRITTQLRVYHCVHFSKMSDREKELIQIKVVEALRGDQILNPAGVMQALIGEGHDFAPTEDRFIGSN